MADSYVISQDGISITCLTCGRKSFNKNDVIQKYCGYCHKFHEVGMNCDFCIQKKPIVREYEAVAHIIGTFDDGRKFVDQDGIWCACSECDNLIQNEKWGELVDRGLAGALASHYPFKPPSMKEARKGVIVMYTMVFGEKFTLRS